MTTTLTDHPERRATDAQPTQFDRTLGAGASPHPAFAGAQIESIDLDAFMPPGHDGDEGDGGSKRGSDTRQAAPPDSEAARVRHQLARFRVTLNDFDMTQVTQVGIDDVKRGDVIEIRTVVGSIYLSIVDRIRGIAAGTGEVLCECRYDLPNQHLPLHAASVVLPLCAKSHLISLPDGSQRKASRALRIAAAIELPPPVRNLLRENFFTAIRIHANPRPERLRAIDLLRALGRLARLVKATLFRR